MQSTMEDVECPKEGDTIVKRNFTCFPSTGTPFLKVESVKPGKSPGELVINMTASVRPEHVFAPDPEQLRKLQTVWENCTLQESVPVEGRVPCMRADGQSKVKVEESRFRAKLFEIRLKRNDMSFQAYRCPECQNIHIGRNPYWFS